MSQNESYTYHWSATMSDEGGFWGKVTGNARRTDCERTKEHSSGHYQEGHHYKNLASYTAKNTHKKYSVQNFENKT